MKRAFNGKRARSRRGMSLFEVLIASTIGVTVMGIAMGAYVHSLHGFSREQAQSYTQFRTRTSLDNIAKDVRSAKSFVSSYGAYSACDGSGTSGGCVILQVPSQDSATMGLFYYGAGSATPNVLVTDIVIYRHNRDDKTLRCTVVPSVKVAANDGQTHSSYRTAMSDEIVAANLESLRFVFRDRDGNPVATGSESRTAAVDILTNVKQERSGGPIESATGIAISGVRLRNMRSGSIPGNVTSGGVPLPGAILTAIYTSTDGAYQANTIVGQAGSDANGEFEIFGLESGTYTVQATAAGRTTTNVTSINVPEEESSDPVTINMS